MSGEKDMAKKKRKMKEEAILQAGKKAGKKAGKIVSEFKEFISRGNVIDLAVGIIVGSAFTKIVTSIVNDLVTPLLGIIIGGIDFTTLKWTFNSFIFPDYVVNVTYGNLIQSVISFLVISVCIFFVVKAMNAFKRGIAPEPESEIPPVPADIELLTEIRDLLKKQNGIPPETCVEKPDENTETCD